MDARPIHDPTADLEPYVEAYYHHFLNGFTYHCGPLLIQDGDQKIIVASTEYPIVSEFDRLTSDKLHVLNMLDVELSDSSSITRLYNFLIDETIEEIRTVIRNYDTVALFHTLYGLAAYVSEFHNHIDLVVHGEYTVSELSIRHWEKTLLESILNHPTEFRHNMEIVKGTDKVILQYLFPLLLTTTVIESHQYSLTPDIVFKLITLGGVAVKLIADREIATSKLSPETTIKIQNGIIQPSVDFFTRFSRFIERNMSRQRTYDVPDQVLAVLVRNFEHCFGFSPKTLESFLTEVNSRGMDDSITIIVALDQLIQMVVDFTGVAVEEALRLVQYFSLAPPSDSQFIFRSPEQYDKRLWEHPLAVYGDESVILVLLSVPLLVDAFRILIHKIKYNLIPECAGRSADVIERKIKNQLVLDAKNILETYDESNVIVNVQDLVVQEPNKTKRVHLEREVDVLCCINKTLFVLECKDISGRFTGAGFRVDSNKVNKFVANMRKKIHEIESKLQDISTYFGQHLNSIVPIIVFRNPNIAMASAGELDEVVLISIDELDSTVRSLISGGTNTK